MKKLIILFILLGCGRETVKTYSENGSLSTVLTFKNDKLDGLAKNYYDNGQLVSELYYKDDKLDGIAKTYWGNGQLNDEGYYEEGKKEGLWKFYDETGKLGSVGYYEEGKTEGFWKEYDETGLRICGSFKNDIKVGFWKLYDRNGQLVRISYWKDGVIKDTIPSEDKIMQLLSSPEYWSCPECNNLRFKSTGDVISARKDAGHSFKDWEDLSFGLKIDTRTGRFIRN